MYPPTTIAGADAEAQVPSTPPTQPGSVSTRRKLPQSLLRAPPPTTTSGTPVQPDTSTTPTAAPSKRKPLAAERPGNPTKVARPATQLVQPVAAAAAPPQLRNAARSHAPHNTAERVARVPTCATPTPALPPNNARHVLRSLLSVPDADLLAACRSMTQEGTHATLPAGSAPPPPPPSRKLASGDSLPPPVSPLQPAPAPPPPSPHRPVATLAHAPQHSPAAQPPPRPAPSRTPQAAPPPPPLDGTPRPSVPLHPASAVDAAADWLPAGARPARTAPQDLHWRGGSLRFSSEHTQVVRDDHPDTLTVRLALLAQGAARPSAASGASTAGGGGDAGGGSWQEPHFAYSLPGVQPGPADTTAAPAEAVLEPALQPAGGLDLRVEGGAAGATGALGPGWLQTPAPQAAAPLLPAAKLPAPSQPPPPPLAATQPIGSLMRVGVFADLLDDLL